MAHMNLISLYQDKFQDIQDFRDQYMAMRKVCDKLGLKFGTCVDDARAVLEEKGVCKPTSAQLKRELIKKLKRNITPSYSYTKPTNRDMENLSSRWKMLCYREKYPMQIVSWQDGKINLAIGKQDLMRLMTVLYLPPLVMRTKGAVRKKKSHASNVK